MGIFSNLEGNWPPPVHDDFWYGPIGWQGADSGMQVTPETAVTYSAIWAAINIVAGTLGSLPAIMYRRRGGGRGRDRADDHPLYPLMRWQPNPWQTAMEFFEMGQTHVMLRGNAVTWVQRTGTNVTALIPWDPDMVRMEFINGNLFYKLDKTMGGHHLVPMEDIWHVRGPHARGLWGISPIAAHAQAIGLGMAAEAYGARFFRNNASPTVVLEHPSTLSATARKNITDSWVTAQGGRNQHSVALLEEGLAIKKLGVTPEEAQFLATRAFSITDVARIYNVPVHLLKELTNSHFNNVEQQNLELVRDTVRPVATRWEQQATRTFWPMGAGGIFMEFLIDALLRGDVKTRQEAQEIRWRSGALTLNEWRANEGDNPYDGEMAEVGDAAWVPANMMPATLALDPPEPEPIPIAGDDDDDDEAGEEDARYLEHRGAAEVATLNKGQKRSLATRVRLRGTFHKLLRRTAQHVVDREVKSMGRALTARAGDREAFLVRVASYYEGFEAQARNLYRPTIEAYAEQSYATASREVGGDGDMAEDDQAMVGQYAATLALRHVSSSRGQLEALAQEEEWEAAVTERLENWQATRAKKVADREQVQTAEFFTLLAYAALSVTKIRWVTFGPNCPLCNRLSGKVVGTQEAFVAQGEELVGDETTRITPRRIVRHAPLHKGCNCAITAEEQG